MTLLVNCDIISNSRRRCYFYCHFPALVEMRAQLGPSGWDKAAGVCLEDGSEILSTDALKEHMCQMVILNSSWLTRNFPIRASHQPRLRL